MHEIEMLDGETLIVRETDWVKVGADHWVRPGGYGGVPTAELVRAFVGWIGTSWIVQPSRTALLPAALQVEWAVRELELAEDAGQSAPAWLPLPNTPTERRWGFHGAPAAPVCARGLSRRGQRYTVFEVTVSHGVKRYAVVIDGEPLSRDGTPVLYDYIHEAIYDGDCG